MVVKNPVALGITPQPPIPENSIARILEIPEEFYPRFEFVFHPEIEWRISELWANSDYIKLL